MYPRISPVSVAPRPPSQESDVTQYKFVDDSNAIELEIEELTAKAVVLEESLDMIEADWKGKPMDKATLDVVTTLGLERGDIMRKLESLQKQKRLMELERDRRNRTRIINKTLKAVTTRPSEAPDSPAPLPNSSVSNSDDLEVDTVGGGTTVHRVSSSHSSTLANDTTDNENAAVGSEDAPVRSNSNGNGSRVRHRTKVSRRRDASATSGVLQEDESMAASEDSSPSNSQVVVKHRVRRPSNRTLSSPVALAVTTEDDATAATQQPLKKASGSGERNGSGLTSSGGGGGGGGSIVERLRAAALAKEQEKKRLLEQKEAEEK